MNDLVWRPHPKQQKFIELPSRIFFDALYGGALGGGKSEVLVMLPILKGYHRYSDFTGLILRRTFRELEGSLIAKSKKYYPRVGATYNESKKTWTFKSGAQIEFGHIEHKGDETKYDSKEYQYVAFDELTHFEESMYNYITTQRMRSTNSNLIPICRSASNPGNIGHLWVRRRFVDPCREGGVRIIDEDTEQSRIFIQSFLTDNPTVTENDPNYQKRVKGMSEAEYKAKIGGDWYVFQGQVFEEFRSERLSDEPENALHVISPVEIPKFCPRILAIDWGQVAYTAAYWGAILPNGQVHIYREYCKRDKLISEWAQDIADMCGDEVLADIVLDPSAWQRRGEAKSIHQQMMDASGLVARKASNDRVSGKQLVHEYLRWQERKKKPVLGTYSQEEADRIFRQQGPVAHREYLQYYSPAPVDGILPKLQIHNTCPKLIDTMPVCSYDEREGKVVEDVKEFIGDDPYDAIRYLLKAIDRYLSRSVEEHKMSQRRVKLHQDFLRTRDFGHYHRALRRLESNDEEGVSLLPRDPRAAFKRYQFARAGRGI